MWDIYFRYPIMLSIKIVNFCSWKKWDVGYFSQKLTGAHMTEQNQLIQNQLSFSHKPYKHVAECPVYRLYSQITGTLHKLPGTEGRNFHWEQGGGQLGALGYQ